MPNNIAIIFFLLSLNVMFPKLQTNPQEADVSAAVMEIKMSATHSCRVNKERTKKPQCESDVYGFEYGYVFGMEEAHLCAYPDES